MQRRSFPIKISIKNKEDKELDAKFQQIGNYRGQRGYDSGEIDFSKNPGIGHKGIGCSGETGGEVIPHRNTGQIEQKRGHDSGTDSCQIIEHNRKRYRSKQRLD